MAGHVLDGGDDGVLTPQGPPWSQTSWAVFPAYHLTGALRAAGWRARGGQNRIRGLCRLRSASPKQALCSLGCQATPQGQESNWPTWSWQELQPCTTCSPLLTAQSEQKLPSRQTDGTARPERDRMLGSTGLPCASDPGNAPVGLSSPCHWREDLTLRAQTRRSAEPGGRRRLTEERAETDSSGQTPLF